MDVLNLIAPTNSTLKLILLINLNISDIMIEVEVKAHVKDFNSVKNALSNLNAERIKTEYQEDIYFNAPHRDFAKTDEALRIRKVSKTGFKDSKYEKLILTYKGKKMDSISKTRKEIEVEIKDMEKISAILENIGFLPVAKVNKKRIIYNYQGFIISLDDVLNVGNFVEIETEAHEGENFEDSLKQIFEIYKKLGIKNGFERRSYLELMGIYI